MAIVTAVAVARLNLIQAGPRAAATPVPTVVPWPVTFSDPLSAPNQANFAPDSGDPAHVLATYDQGEYVIRTVDPQWGRTRSELLPDNYFDASIAVDARLVGDTAGRYLSLLCRRDPQQQSGYDLTVDAGAGQFELSRWDNGKQTFLVSARSSAEINRGTAVNRVELRCQGSAIGAVINGRLVASASDRTYGGGRLAVSAGTYTGQVGTVEAHFRNLAVARPPQAP